jgi:hypothetical protein
MRELQVAHSLLALATASYAFRLYTKTVRLPSQATSFPFVLHISDWLYAWQRGTSRSIFACLAQFSSLLRFYAKMFDYQHDAVSFAFHWIALGSFAVDTSSAVYTA